LETMTDAQLAISSQKGDREAFSALASRVGGSLQGLLRRELGDAEAARDLCQETFIRAWLHIDRLRDPESFRPWIHRIALNMCRDRLRSARRGVHETGLGDEANDKRSQDPDPLDRLESLDAAERVDRMLERLSAEQRVAIVLREIHGLTSTEIGRITGVSPATVRTRIYYGFMALRRTFSEGNATASGQATKGTEG
jgi:RNA polymerase sigma-70 factor (ECF subfamily)